MATDEELVAAVQQGSTAAFGELVERYQARLLRFLVGRCGSRADAEDALQDTFVNAYRYIRTYDPRWRFSTWLYRIALRNATRQAVHGAGFPESLEADSDPLADCIVDSERENLWLLAKKVLSADAYAALWLHYAEDLNLNEVARVLGRSLAWTKVTMMRSRRSMGKELVRSDCRVARGELYG